MRILLLSLFIFSSCNVMKSLTGGETNLDESFFRDKSSLNNGLIEFWGFNESGTGDRQSTQGSILIDNAGVSSTNGQYGKAVDCTTGSSMGYHLQDSGFNHNINTGGSFTFSSRFAGTSLGSIGHISQADTLQFYIEIGPSGGGANDDINLFVGGVNLIFLDHISDTSFYNYVFVIDNNLGNVDLYIDGNYVETKSYSASAIVMSNFGVCSGSGGGSSAVKIDSIGLWNRMLSSSEILELNNGEI